LSGFFSAEETAKRLKSDTNISKIESIALDKIAIELLFYQTISFKTARKKAIKLEIIVAFFCIFINIFKS